MRKQMVLLVLFSLGIALGLSAQTATPNVTKNQVAQKQRIKQGLRSGEITRGEAVKLTKQQARIVRAKHRAKADGVVTPGESATLRARQAKASKNIYRKKHNGSGRH